MKSFFKIFFATLLALIIFCLIGIFLLAGLIGGVVKTEKVKSLQPHSVMEISLGKKINEQPALDPVGAILKKKDFSTFGLRELTGKIDRAAEDKNMDGIFLKLNGSPNGWATNDELRKSLNDFKASGKFIIAYGDVISQNDYFVATAADKIYLNPEGDLEFKGFASTITFFKEAMDKLDIKANIFYDGKFKSATEPFRRSDMTEANRVQTRAYLNDLYGHFLKEIAVSRKVDSALLQDYANKALIQSAEDALHYGLVDGLAYPDEVLEKISLRVPGSQGKELNFVPVADYSPKGNTEDGNPKIAIVYAQGDITDGSQENAGTPGIPAAQYVPLWKEIRENKDIKGVVFRVNSPGGSALASDKIWREVMLTRQIKPVIVSMGDYAASGGYYISCAADSIFAEATTLTGSIGVFGIIPDLQRFFKNKLGVTFDGVKTADFADMGNVTRPMTEAEKAIIQKGVDRVYDTFKEKVSKGRNLNAAVVDSIAQGRVWSGETAVKIGLVDGIGGIGTAIKSAARKAGLSAYSIEEFPKKNQAYEKILSQLTENVTARWTDSPWGTFSPVFKTIENLSKPSGRIQARLPYDITIW